MKKVLLFIIPLLIGCTNGTKMTDDIETNDADVPVLPAVVDNEKMFKKESVIDVPISGSLEDYSKFRHKVKIRGGRYVQNRKGEDSSALFLNGVNQHIIVPYNPELYSKNYTLSIWVNIKEFPDTSKGYSHVFGCFDHHVGEWGTQIWIGTEEIGGSIGGGKNDHLLLSSSSIDTCGVKVGEWHHLALIHDEQTHDFKIYIDGVPGEVPNHYGSGGAFEGDDNVQWKKAFQWAIGDIPSYIYHANPVSRSFTGSVDEIKLFNYVLSNEEILALALDK